MINEESERVLVIPKIENGIVIDHIPAGLGRQILEIIRSDPKMKDVVITVGLNFKSTKHDKKDLIKLQTRELPEKILQHISLISPGVSIKRIINYEVDKKYVLQAPKSFTDLAVCGNPNCVTNNEGGVETRFVKVGENGTRYKCMYCERVFDLSELEFIEG
jgi:aspartate carbamoyltransferase regulatory subunit